MAHAWFAGALEEVSKVPGGAQAVKATAQPQDGVQYPVKLV